MISRDNWCRVMSTALFCHGVPASSVSPCPVREGDRGETFGGPAMLPPKSPTLSYVALAGDKSGIPQTLYPNSKDATHVRPQAAHCFNFITKKKHSISLCYSCFLLVSYLVFPASPDFRDTRYVATTNSPGVVCFCCSKRRCLTA